MVYADYREKGSGIARELSESGVVVKLESLSWADYILSSRVGIEFKKVDDFVDSIIDGRLLQQIKDLKNNLENVNIALGKITEGTYGLCEKCGEQIELEVLKAEPESRLCKTHKKLWRMFRNFIPPKLTALTLTW